MASGGKEMVRLVRTSWLLETYGERETCEEREKEEGAGTCIFHTTVDAGVCPPPFPFFPHAGTLGIRS